MLAQGMEIILFPILSSKEQGMVLGFSGCKVCKA